MNRQKLRYLHDIFKFFFLSFEMNHSLFREKKLDITEKHTIVEWNSLIEWFKKKTEIPLTENNMEIDMRIQNEIN